MTTKTKKPKIPEMATPKKTLISNYGNEHKKKILLDWLNERIGETIDSIFRSEFSFEN
jgi:hypothetical protein